MLNREWVNSRGVIFRFDRRALEVRVMDEQECVKSDVALACFVRATLRGLISQDAPLQSHVLLVKDFNAVVSDGLNAKTLNPEGKTARDVCQHFLKIAQENADENEKKYLWLIKKRIDEGNLSDLIRERVGRRASRTGMHEAIIEVYSTLIKSLNNNEPYL